MKRYFLFILWVFALYSTSLSANVRIFLGKLTYKDAREQWVQLVLYESLRLSLVGKKVLKNTRLLLLSILVMNSLRNICMSIILVFILILRKMNF
jgi:hypothetical protein